MRVLARAYGDRPLDRVAVGENGRVIYVANPSTVNSTGKCESGGIGFPKRYVFAFDSELFDSLSQAWEVHDTGRLTQLWKQATPLPSDAIGAT